MIREQNKQFLNRFMLITLGLLLSCATASAWFSGKSEKNAEAEKLPPEYAKLNDQLDQARKGYDRLAAKLDAAIRTAKEKLQQRQNEKTALENEIGVTDKAITKLKQINEERYAELEKQQQKLEEIKTILAAKSTRIQELVNAVQAEKALQEKESKTASLETRIQQLEEQTQALKDAQAKALAEVDAKVTQLTAEKAEQAKAITQLKRNLTRTRNKLDSANLNNNELSFEVQELKDAVASYEQEKQSALKGVSSSLKEFEKFISESSR